MTLLLANLAANAAPYPVYTPVPVSGRVCLVPFSGRDINANMITYITAGTLQKQVLIKHEEWYAMNTWEYRPYQGVEVGLGTREVLTLTTDKPTEAKDALLALIEKTCKQ